MLLFLVNDVFVKLASATLPITQIISIRAVLATVILVPLVWWSGGFRSLPLLRNWAVLFRTLAEVLAAICFLTALAHIPIANVNTINQVVPLMITAAGAMFLGEAVGWRRWTAIVVGFIGVAIVIRPGLEGFTVYSLFALAAAFAVTVRDLTTRMMPRGLPALLVALITAIAVGIAGPIFAPLFGETWIIPPAPGLGLVALSVVFLVGGYITAVDFMRHGDIAVVAPFRYTVIVYAMIAGFLVWGDIPDALMLVGTAVIAATGVYTIHRERSRARLAAQAIADETG